MLDDLGDAGDGERIAQAQGDGEDHRRDDGGADVAEHDGVAFS